MKTREVILKGMGSPNASHKVPKKIIIRKNLVIYSCSPYWGLAVGKIERNSSFLELYQN